MRPERRFAEKTLKEISWWAWGASILPITALAGLFFIWIFGTESLYDISMITGGTFMFATAAVWWWWIIWTVAKIMRKDRKIAQDFKDAVEKISEIKDTIKENSSQIDK